MCMFSDPRIRKFLAFSLLLNALLAIYRFALGPRILIGRHDAQCAQIARQHHGFYVNVESMDMPARRLPYSNLDIKRARITHVVIPFDKGQEAKVTSNLELWRHLPPCPPTKPDSSTHQRRRLDQSQKSGEPFFLRDNHPAGPLGRNISLTFFCSSDFDPDLEVRIAKAFLALPDTVQQCFSHATLRFGGFLADTDTPGSADNRMFRHMADGKIGLIEPYYVLYIDPEIQPIRPNWLVTLDALTRWPNPHFWIKGSLSRSVSSSRHTKTESEKTHKLLTINRAAIYNFGDFKFHAFLKEMIYYHLFGQSRFDIAIFNRLATFQNYQIAISLAHLFQYTDAILDISPASYSLSELTTVNELVVLVRGGKQNP